MDNNWQTGTRLNILTANQHSAPGHPRVPDKGVSAGRFIDDVCLWEYDHTLIQYTDYLAYIYRNTDESADRTQIIVLLDADGRLRRYTHDGMYILKEIPEWLPMAELVHQELVGKQKLKRGFCALLAESATYPARLYRVQLVGGISSLFAINHKISSNAANELILLTEGLIPPTEE